jgi:GT2 family glycosyltransferase
MDLTTANSFGSESQTKHQAMDFVFRLSDTILLCCGELGFNLNGKEDILLNNKLCQKPYVAGILPSDSGNKTLLIIRTTEENQATDYADVNIVGSEQTTMWYHHSPIQQGTVAFHAFLQTLNEVSKSKILWLLVRLSAIDSSVNKYSHYVELCLNCYYGIPPISEKAPSSFWLLPNLLYMELSLPLRDYKKARLLMLNAQQILGANIQLVSLHSEPQTGLEKYAALIIFPHADAIFNAHHNAYALITADSAIALTTPTGATETNLEGLIAYITSFPENVRLSLRDFLTRELAKLIVVNNNERVASIIKTLQTYFLPNHSSIFSNAFPFGANIELAFSLQQDYIFIGGWLHDPMDLVDGIMLTSDLGFSISMKGKLNFYHRPDVALLFAESPFPITNQQCGFVALLDFPDELKKQIPAAIETFNYRFTIKLKSGLSYNIAPKAEYFDPTLLRNNILELSSYADASSEAFEAMRRTGNYLNRLHSLNTSILRQKHYGTAVEYPFVSIIIPLYKNLEYIAVQMAHFANDAFMKRCEIILVLDSPEQEKIVCELAGKLSSTYDLAIKLLILSNNGGFAVASNIGAAQARSEYLLFLNSDVVPTSYGWLEKMLASYKSNNNIGALAPKLLYEDDSIQHAGMYFALDHAELLYENLHYYKGYPANHLKSNSSRTVAAVTAACLLIEKAKFEAVNHFSTDYIIGDFEDSDLCLKLLEKGLYNYYLADVSLYHFERQSMNNVTLNNKARYMLNATTQYDKWHNFIAEVIKQYD